MLHLDSSQSLSHRESLRALLRSVSTHERESLKVADDNRFSLLFLCSQIQQQQKAASSPRLLEASVDDSIDGGYDSVTNDLGGLIGDDDLADSGNSPKILSLEEGISSSKKKKSKSNYETTVSEDSADDSAVELKRSSKKKKKKSKLSA